MQTRHRVALVILVVIVVILVFLGIFLALGKTKRSRDDSTMIPSHPDPNIPHHPSNSPIFKGLLANTIDGTVLLLDLESSDYDLMVEEYVYGVTAFDYYLNESVYYATTKPFEPIKSTTERNEDLMGNSRRWSKTALAVDFVTRKVYVIDGVTEQLHIVDFRGDHFAVLLADLKEPKDIALDPARRLMFVLQASSILQANMDGTEVKTILEDPELLAFTLDRDSARIYYSSSCAIRSMSYANDSSSPLLIAMTDDAVSSLAALDKQLYFVGTFEESGRRSLTACSIIGNACKKYRHDVVDPWIASKLQSIKAYDIRVPMKNPCGRYNGNCEHLCVLTNNQRIYTCVCSTGYQLNTDRKTCSRIDNYLLYVEDNKIRRSLLKPAEKSPTISVDSNTVIDASALRMKKLINFDYSFDNNLLVYTDYSKMHFVDLINGTTWTIEKSVDCGLIPAVDWLSNKLYYARNCRNQSNRLMVRNVDDKAIFESENFLLKLNRQVGALVVHPFRELIFYTEFSKEYGKYLLRGVYANGSELDFGQDIVVYETGLCIDYVNDRLYWLSNDATKIVHANFNDFKPRTIDVSVMVNPRTVSVFNDWLYITNLTEIWRLNKETGADAVRVVPASTDKISVIHGAKVFGRSVQPIDKHRVRSLTAI